MEFECSQYSNEPEQKKEAPSVAKIDLEDETMDGTPPPEKQTETVKASLKLFTVEKNEIK